MKMLKKIKLFLFLIILVLSFFKIQNFCSNALISDYYSFSFDPILAKDLTNSIAKYSNQNLKNNSPEILFKAIKNEFPVVNSISILRNSYTSIKIKVDAEIPNYKINDDLILTSQFQLLETNCFSQSYIDSLESISVQFDKSNKPLNIELEFIKFISEFPKNLLTDFKINYNKKNEIFLTSKEDQQFLILTKYDKIPNSKIVEQCKRIKNEKNIQSNKKFIADLRFNDQVMVSIIQGGNQCQSLMI